MSYIVEKSLNSLLHTLVGASSVLNTNEKTNSNKSCSSGLLTFVEKLEDAAKISKQEEEDYVNKEYQYWLKMVSTQEVKISTIADILCRGLIAYSKGHRSFNFHIQAIKLTQCDSIFEQRIGALYLSRTLSPTSDLTVLLVNSLQVNLNSGKHLQIVCGLCLIPLVSIYEVNTVIITLVLSCFKSQHFHIRKMAAAMALSLFNSQCEKEFLHSTLLPELATLLGDNEPSVVIAAILSFSTIIQKSDPLKDNVEIRHNLGKICASVIVQSLNRKLPESYNFNKTIAPMVIVQILRSLNGIANKLWQPPVEVEESLHLVLSQEISDHNLGQCMSIIEAIHTTAAISSNGELVSLSLSAAIRFIKSSNIDFKYVGIKALTVIFPKVQNLIGESHVKLVMECLYNCNPNLEKKSLKLLMAMVGPQNYQDLCVAILEYCAQMTDRSVRMEVLDFLNQVVSDLDVDTEWCLKILPLVIKCDTDSAPIISGIVKVISKTVMLSNDSSASLASTCQNTIQSLLTPEIVELKTLTLSASLLTIQIRLNYESIPYSLFRTFYDQLMTLDNFSVYHKEIVDFIVMCGVYEERLLEESKEILNIYLEKVDFLSSFTICRSIELLTDPALTKNLYARQAEIIRMGSIDLTLSFADKFLIKSEEQGVVYRPPGLLEQTTKFNEDEKISVSSRGSSQPVGNRSLQLTPMSSIQDTTIMDSFKLESPKVVWTKEGRKPVETAFEVGSTDISTSAEVVGQSIEVADEAAEDVETEDSNSVGKLNMMSLFLKGLKFSE